MSNPTENTSANAQELLERVKTQSGPAYWRSLEELVRIMATHDMAYVREEGRRGGGAADA